MVKIGWIGIGHMGKNMARRVLQAGYTLHIFDADAAQMQGLVQEGAVAEDSAAAVARAADILFATIPNGRVLKAITYGDSGVAAGISPGKIFADISTVDVETSREVGKALEGLGAYFLRCPVSGSTVQAGNGSLMIMASGSREAYRRAEPLLELFGRERYYLGEGDEARVMKLVIQSMVGVQFQSYAEALTLGDKAGIDWETMVEIISKCSASSINIQNKVEAFKTRDFSPMSTVFTQLKDMNLVLDLAREYHVPLPITTVATQYYNAMVATGRGNYDYGAILLVNEENCGLAHKRETVGE